MGKRERQRAARRARKDAATAEREAHVTLFHGTAYALDESVRLHGLRPPEDGRRGPFLTSDRARAQGYGVRAAVWHGEQTGQRDDRLIVYTVRAPRAALRVDEAEDDGTAWWVLGGVPPEWVIGWESFDGGPAVLDRRGIVQDMRAVVALENLKRPRIGDSLDELAAVVYERCGDLAVDQGAQLAADTCTGAGLRVLGWGFGRVVLEVDDHRVAKVGWNANGRSGCANEAALWRSALTPTRELLCPCEKLTAGGVLVMRRADPIISLTASIAERLEIEVAYAERLARPRQQLLGIGLRDDLGVHQWGNLDGRLVLCDYDAAAPDDSPSTAGSAA